MSSSPMPPGTSGCSPLAGWYTTSGSAPSTRGLEVMVSVAVMPTLAALTPAAAQIPLPSTALGMAVIRMGSPGSGTSTWDSTER